MHITKGKHAVLESLSSSQKPDRVLVSIALRSHPDGIAVIKAAKTHGLKVQWASKEELDRFGEHHQGMIAVHTSWQTIELEHLIRTPEKYPIIVMADHLEDPYNFGAIMRSCLGFGVSALIYPKDRNVQITHGVIKASAGAAHHLPLIKVTNLAQSLDRLKDAGYWVYGLDGQADTSLRDFTPQFPCVIIAGNEHRGLSPLLTKKTDMRVSIPLNPKLESLNVSVATGVALYHVSGCLSDISR